MAIPTPTIHLNGTSREELQRQMQAAYEAGEAYLTALALAAPNGRDYYPQGPEALQEALFEHRARLVSVAAVQDDLLAICEALI